ERDDRHPRDHATTLSWGVLVGVMLATALGGTFVFVGARHMRTRWLGLHLLPAYERSLLAMRAALTAPFSWRTATAADAADVAPLELARADDRTLVANGFRPLGEGVTTGRMRGAM